MTGEAFYRRGDGDAVVPTALAAGPPWVPDSQHGSTVTALVARAVEATPAAVPMHLARLTVELARTVPMGPTEVHVTPARDGRRVQVLDATVVVAGEPRVRATALRIRREDGVVAAADAPAPWDDDRTGTRPVGPAAPSPLRNDALWQAHDARWEDATPGAGVVWLRPQRELVEGEPLTPLVRVALVADLVMSGGGLLSIDDYVVVNPDLTLTLTRLPAGEWIKLCSRVRLDVDGTGQSEGELFDERGWIGRVLKPLLVSRRTS